MTHFSDQDITQIREHGLTIDAINQQMADFVTGFPYTQIIRPATINDGVLPMLDASYAKYYTDKCNNFKIIKFVPASGAATRMFKDLFEYLSTNTMNKTTQTVLDNLDKFAFYDDLTQYLPENPTAHDIIECIVTDRGLNYGNSPKGLIQFHKYNNIPQTGAAEHLAEGAQYACANGAVNLHFTVSPEHIAGFRALFEKLVPQFESQTDKKYNITMSTQKPETDTIAVNPDNTPFRNDDGTLLFRPAGHGALIENLNDLDADIIFIKNIDNVCPEHARADTVLHKQMLAGLAIQTQEQIFKYIRAIDNGTANRREIHKYICNTLGIVVPESTNLRDILNRPLRICGIIKNTGEPGGGPFWVQSAGNISSLQIVEPGQISPEQKHILHDGEFFSPTDIICMPYDVNGKKFNLTQFTDPRTGFISEKSKNGRTLRAMERPGLWNGAMAQWNTIFVETPLTTFTPVKVITDLLNASHK